MKKLDVAKRDCTYALLCYAGIKVFTVKIVHDRFKIRKVKLTETYCILDENF